MPQNINCPWCARLLKLPNDKDRLKVRCPNCSEVFVVDEPIVIATEVPTPTVPDMQDEATSWRQTESHWDRADDDHDISVRFTPGEGFVPGGVIALLVKLMLGLNIVMLLVVLWSNYWQYNLGARMQGARVNLIAEAMQNDARQQVVGLIYRGIYLTTGLLFLLWFRRAHANLPALGARDLNYTPGWAIGAWFVPILNLFRPAQIAQEIWRNSDPDAVHEDAVHESASSSSSIQFWWGIWLLCSFVNLAAAFATVAVHSPDTLMLASAVAMAANCVTLFAAALALIVVSEIDRRQSARFNALMTGPQRNEEESDGRTPRDDPAPTSLGDDYTSGAIRASFLKLMLGITMIVLVAALAMDYLQYDLTWRSLNRRGVRQIEVESNEFRQLIVWIIRQAVYFITAIVFLGWFYRAHANLRALGARELRYGSGWAIGAWFVPILNLIRPVQIAQEIWRNSDPAAVTSNRYCYDPNARSTLIGFWWATFLIGNIASQVALRLSLAAQTPDALRPATLVSMAGTTAAFVAAGLAFWVVADIDDRQTARATALVERGRAEEEEYQD